MASGAQGHTTQTITTPNEALNAVFANLKAGPHIDRTTLKRIPPAFVDAVEVTSLQRPLEGRGVVVTDELAR